VRYNRGRVPVPLAEVPHHMDERAMKKRRAIQFAIAALLDSAGCVALLEHAPTGISTICFCCSPLLLMRRSELGAVVSRRELWIFMAGLLVLAIALILGNVLLSGPTLERVASHPAIVFPLWILLLFTLFVRWRTEQQAASKESALCPS
jgi:hypothetical protein